MKYLRGGCKMPPAWRSQSNRDDQKLSLGSSIGCCLKKVSKSIGAPPSRQQNHEI